MLLYFIKCAFFLQKRSCSRKLSFSPTSPILGSSSPQTSSLWGFFPLWDPSLSRSWPSTHHPHPTYYHQTRPQCQALCLACAAPTGSDEHQSVFPGSGFLMLEGVRGQKPEGSLCIFSFSPTSPGQSHCWCTSLDS